MKGGVRESCSAGNEEKQVADSPRSSEETETATATATVCASVSGCEEEAATATATDNYDCVGAQAPPIEFQSEVDGSGTSDSSVINSFPSEHQQRGHDNFISLDCEASSRSLETEISLLHSLEPAEPASARVGGNGNHKIFGFPLSFDFNEKNANEVVDKQEHHHQQHHPPVCVTRQLLPVDDVNVETLSTECSAGIPLTGYHTQWPIDEASESKRRETNSNNQVGKKNRRGPRSRSSQYRGVTYYRRTGRWESHIWDCGKQVYLGGFDTAHAAATAYDRAAIKFRGVEADINFSLNDYEEEMKQV